jgi:SAM-dependent methyltransferase
MLYHIPDQAKAIHEISRVLKPHGALYASTFGLDNMKELTELVAAYNDKIPNSLEPFGRAFGLENGKKQLSASFKDVEMIKYEDSLEVTEVQPLVDYVLSFSQAQDILKDNLKEFSDYLGQIMEKEGKIKITKNSGMFIGKNPL